MSPTKKHISGIFLGAVLGFLLSTGCTVEASHTQKTLKGAGYTDIRLGGHAWFDCSQDDTRSTSFKAKGPTGNPVSGAVCCGTLAKNCTIRLD